jgi:hypothetical protein
MNKDMTSAENADLHLLYQVTTQDLAFFKSQQWSITNYTFLIYAGVVGLNQLKRDSEISAVLLSAVALSAAASAIYLLRRLEKSIEGRRARLTFIRGKLSNLFNEAWSVANKEESTFLIPLRILGTALGLGAMLTCWVVS